MIQNVCNTAIRLSRIALVGVTVAALFAVGCGEHMVADPGADGEAAAPSAATNRAHGGAVKNFAAPLSGDQEVPAVETNATGLAKFKLSKDGTTLSYVRV